MPSRSWWRKALAADDSDTGPPGGDDTNARHSPRGAPAPLIVRVSPSAAEQERDPDARAGPERAGEGAEDEPLGGRRGPRLGRAPPPLTREAQEPPARRAGQQRGGDAPPSQTADPRPPTQDRRTLRPAADADGRGVGRTQHGG